MQRRDVAGATDGPQIDDSTVAGGLTALAALRGLEATGDARATVRPLLEMLGQLSGLEAVYLTRIHWAQGKQEIEVARNVGPEGFEVTEGLRVAWSDSLCELSLADGSGWNTDVQGTWGHRAAAQELGIQSYVSVPVMTRDGSRPYGTLCGASPRTVEADPDVVDVLELFAGMIATALERDEALRQAAVRAEDAERRLGERIVFAAEVEHALKTPLSVIGGWADTLRTHGDEPDLLERGLEVIGRTVTRMSGQLSDLLAEARTAIADSPPEEVDVRRLALDLAGAATSHAYSVEGELLLVADPVAVRLLLDHLVENAVRHTPVGTAVRVVLSPGSIVVEDDGPGLPQGRDDLFDAFVSADPEHGGSGLGLHIVRQLAERLEARCEVGASASGGARFEVLLP